MQTTRKRGLSDLGRVRHPSTLVPPMHPSLLKRASYRLEDAIASLKWTHVLLQFLALGYIVLMLWIGWNLLPVAKHWSLYKTFDKIPLKHHEFNSYFSDFKGFSECGVKATDLYNLPPSDLNGNFYPRTFCSTRSALLESLSEGGRVGFDAPYIPKGCQYRWYTVPEICMILSRFDQIVFIGDDSMKPIYSGFNILLRQDLALGSLSTWDMSEAERRECRCAHQFTKESCLKYIVHHSDEVLRTSEFQGSKNACRQTPHALLGITTSPAGADVVARLKQLVPPAPQSNYKPIAIIQSLSPQYVTHQTAASSLSEIIKLSSSSGRKTPTLFLGPTAAGHIETKNRKGNQEIWDFHQNMARFLQQQNNGDKNGHNAKADRVVEMLGMWNLTVQANSWDGMRFGEEVAIVQAMMVVNWLARLESA